jgi:CheY-like chemotaxis protein
MNKSILIHANNIPENIKSIFNEKFIEFDFRNNIEKTLDEYISTTIIGVLKNSNFDIIYIKDNLSLNYLELYGLSVAYHIRLSEKELGVKHLVPIVILSDIDGYTLSKFDPITARILFTKNVFIEPNNKESIDKYRTKVIAEFKENEFKEKFLNLIQIDSPENSSSHSIANEWAIYRWAEYLKVKSEAITINKDAISSMLYFKYLTALNSPDKNKGIGIKIPKQAGKILYIDDEWAKGWSDIFETYFSKTNNIAFETFKFDFKGVNMFTLTSKIKNKLNISKPDLIMLDLRLIENDHNEINREDVTKYTGIKILQIIKEINPGIQVIMFTATSKSMILEELYNHDIVGYIKKEHPEDKNISTKESFTKLANLVDEGLKKKYLKEIWRIQRNILGLNMLKKDTENFIKIKSEVETIFEILDSNLENKIKFTILTIFKALEILTEEYNMEGTEYQKNKLLFHKYGVKKYDTAISEIVCTRNFLVHSGKREKLHRNCMDGCIEKPNQENILVWLKMLQTILEAIDKESI